MIVLSVLLLLPSLLPKAPKDTAKYCWEQWFFSHSCFLPPSHTYLYFPSVKLFSSPFSKNILNEFIWLNKSGKLFLSVLEKAAFQRSWDGYVKGRVFCCMWYVWVGFFFKQLKKVHEQECRISAHENWKLKWLQDLGQEENLVKFCIEQILS